MTSLARPVIKQASRPKSTVPTFLKYIIQRNPGPLNIATFTATSAIAFDDRHPLHRVVNRRLETFDPHRLHWHVRCSLTISKKRVVRSWAARRVTEAFIEELKSEGYGRQGELLGSNGRGLKGAVAISLTEGILTAPFDDVRRRCRQLVLELAPYKKLREPTRKSIEPVRKPIEPMRSSPRTFARR